MVFFKAVVILTDGCRLTFEGRQVHQMLHEIDRSHGSRLLSLDLRKYVRREDGVVQEIESEDGA
jgi:hypothetical protein